MTPHVTDVLRRTMAPWTFTVNWFVKWKDADPEQRLVWAIFVGV